MTGAPTLQRRGLGDDMASARVLLTQRIAEARDVIDVVLANPPAVPCALPELAPPAASVVREESLAEYAEFLLRTRLDPFKSAVFNGADSVRLAVSGKRLKKVSRRLHEALEEFTARSEPVAGLAADLAADYPGHTDVTYAQAAAALLVLGEWDRTHRAPTPAMKRNVLGSIARDGKLRLALFVCPPVDFSRLSGDKPELYIRDHMHGSVLSRLTDRLHTLFRGLEGARVGVELRTFVGDTDEDDYLWHGVTPPAHLDRQALDARREQLVGAVARYLSEEIPGSEGHHPRVLRAEAVRVERLSAVVPSAAAEGIRAAVSETPLDFFDAQDIEAEMALMRSLWQPGSYYDGLAEPDDETLRRIVVHKFAAYAMQGAVLRDAEPDLVLVQTERPPLLRTRMLAAGWHTTAESAECTESSLPTVDFFEPTEDRW
ncbi:hypothetical protein ACMATS_24465 [Streptoverticillium reticulum]|uniref:hypothetical protein n=1 Tax=Streptoverticillium reticulum TaxID=1433415 RepID=UPI0039BF0BF2